MAITKAQIQLTRSLDTTKGRKQTGFVLVETPKVVVEAFGAGLVAEHVFCTSAFEEQFTALTDRVQAVSEKDLQRLSRLNTPHGVVAVFRRPETRKELADRVFVLDRVNDPGNLGTIIRTADWFGGISVVLSEGSVDPFAPKVVQASMGSVFRMNPPRMEVEQIMEMLEGYEKWGTGMSDSSVDEQDLPKRLAVFMGNEANGLDVRIAERCDRIVTIPGGGQAESLNVAMATGILMYQTR